MARPYTPVSMNVGEGDELIIKNEKITKANGDTSVRRYIQGKQLGRGGFAKVYQFTCIETNQVYAAKVIAKASLKDDAHLQKFKTEIKIHRSLDHPGVVKFCRYFDDHENYYILLELCMNDSLSQLLVRRTTLTELEVQYYFVQIVQALSYLREQRILHRDLKSANLLLTDKMKVKIADFGLAAKLSSDFEKRKTTCGTPNFMAPEVLGTKGYSFPIDVWSLGVICYNLLTGTLPFEAPTAKEISNKIQEGKFGFPTNIAISDFAKDFIGRMLNIVPEKRMRLEDMMQHPFLTPRGGIPTAMPGSTVLCAPPSSFVKEYTPLEGPPKTIAKPLKLEKTRDTRARSVEQHRIGAKTPNKPRDEVKFFEKKACTTPSKKHLGYQSNQSNTANTAHTSDTKTSSTKESPMKPEPQPKYQFGAKVLTEPMVEIKEVQVRPQTSNNMNGLKRANTLQLEDKKTAMSASMKNLTPLRAFGEIGRPPASAFTKKASLTIEQTPEVKLVQKVKYKIKTEEKKLQEESEDDEPSIEIVPKQEKKKEEIKVASWPIVRILQWMDHTAGYGLGYTFSDGTIGVLFNDKTRMLTDSKGENFHYMMTSITKKELVTKHSMEDVPKELKSKVVDLQQFIKGFVKNGHKFSTTADTSKKPVFVKKWLNTKYATLFRLSNEDLQVIFVDNSVLVLNPDGKKLTYVNKRGEMRKYNLENETLGKDKGVKKRYIKVLEILEMAWNKRNGADTLKKGERAGAGIVVEPY